MALVASCGRERNTSKSVWNSLPASSSLPFANHSRDPVFPFLDYEDEVATSRCDEQSLASLVKNLQVSACSSFLQRQVG